MNLNQIRFFRDEIHLGHTQPCVSVHLRQPAGQVEEAFHICHVVHHKDALCPPIEVCYYRPEPLVPGGVPQLKLDLGTVHLQGADLEVHTNCWDETMAEYVICVSGNNFENKFRVSSETSENILKNTKVPIKQ